MQELFAKYLNNECSPEEVKELLSYFIVFGNEKTLRNLIVENLADQDLEDEDICLEPGLDKTFAVIKSRMNVEKGKVVPLFRRSWVRIAAAVIFLLGGFAVFSLIKKTNPNQDIVKINSSKPKQNAGSNKAVLSLANGSNIILETVENGTVTKQGGTEIIKLAHGQLVYKLLNEKPAEVLFNSITTPRGGQYEVILSDGSKVWLNAASSLRFPRGF
jgi:ferric-dicitrate binding protein FerR (iron transport regulator)